jgi:hypothetical protein
MSDLPDRITLWTPAPSSDDAKRLAKTRARVDGWRVIEVLNVAYRPGEHGAPGWNVTLSVRRKDGAA